MNVEQAIRHLDGNQMFISDEQAINLVAKLLNRNFDNEYANENISDIYSVIQATQEMISDDIEYSEANSRAEREEHLYRESKEV